MKKPAEIVIPETLRYAKDHEWMSLIAPFRVGVSDFAQDQLGDITYVELPEPGAAFAAGQEFGSLESIKSVSPLYLPADGKVAAINERLRDDPGLVNQDPYGAGWLVEIELFRPEQAALLMDAAAYRRHIGTEA
ncbi:MAG: glycine cleavage system protein GcvH [Planctomycetota bacterium]|jgi:glycine cleavage system H protein|nr:glycine cleavage system protein GcvH [Planctomycetota bacterium]